MGHRGPVLKPRCIGPGSVQTQIPFLFILVRLGNFSRETKDRDDEEEEEEEEDSFQDS
jgi:hypothetical protein